MIAAVQSGQVDATIAIASQAKPLAASGQAHIIGWVGDIVPYQITALFTTDKMIAQHADAAAPVRAAPTRRAWRIIARRSCGIDADGKPIVDAKTDAAIAADRRNTSSPAIRSAREKILAGVGYYDAGGALDVADVTEQLRWFKAQDLVKGDADAGRGDRHAVPADAMSDGLRLVAARRAATPIATCPCCRTSTWSPNRARCWCWSAPPAAANRHCWASWAGCWRRPPARCGSRARWPTIASIR